VDSKQMKSIAGDLVAAIRGHISERLGPIVAKQDAAGEVAGALSRRLDEIEERLAAIEGKSAHIRRIA